MLEFLGSLGLTHDQMAGPLMIAGTLPVVAINYFGKDTWIHFAGTLTCTVGNALIAYIMRDASFSYVAIAYWLYTFSWSIGTIRSYLAIRARDKAIGSVAMA